jgi:hypothetical protein
VTRPRFHPADSQVKIWSFISRPKTSVAFQDNDIKNLSIIAPKLVLTGDILRTGFSGTASVL